VQIEIVRFLIWNRGVNDRLRAASIFFLRPTERRFDPRAGQTTTIFESAIAFGNLDAADIMMRSGVFQTSNQVDLVALAYFSGPMTLKFVLDNICTIYPSVPQCMLECRVKSLRRPTHEELKYVQGLSMDPLPTREFNEDDMQAIIGNFDVGSSSRRSGLLRRKQHPVLVIQKHIRKSLAKMRARKLRMEPHNLFHSIYGRKRRLMLGVEGSYTRMHV
jgi:hypothetical protein